jgi:UDP-glucose 4-epimerase
MVCFGKRYATCLDAGGSRQIIRPFEEGARLKVLVVGRAGYIGSHMVLLLNAAGHTVRVLDNLSSGHADAVPADQLIRGSIGDSAVLDDVFASYAFDAVMHFASFVQVGESVGKS